MSERQYIGARYVPIVFSNPTDGSSDWISGYKYEPLTIVTYLNQSYTSKKPVPANIGNPASNPSYWVLTGAYNAQIAQLTGLIDDVDVHTRDKIICIGASINLSTTGMLAGGFPDNAFNQLDYPTEDYYNSAVAGSGFTAGTKTFEGQLDDIINVASDNFKSSNVRVIVVGGMNNDINAGESYLPAVDSFVTKVHNNFSHATVEFVPLSWSRVQTRRVNLRTLYETYIKLMPDHGVIVWDEFYAYMHNYTNWFRDDIHFSQIGINVMSRMFQKVITKSSMDMNPNEGLVRPFTPQNINTEAFTEVSNFVTIREYYDGNMVWLFSGESLLKPVSDGITLSNSIGSPTVVCDNPFHYIGCTPFADGTKYGEFPCSIRNYTGLDYVDAFMAIDTNNKLTFYARKIFNLGGGQFSNVKFFAIGIPREFC